jgi:hypothetical protein
MMMIMMMMSLMMMIIMIINHDELEFGKHVKVETYPSCCLHAKLKI